MKIPDGRDKVELVNWVRDLRDECTVSVDRRRLQYSFWKSLYYTGSIDNVPSKRNRCYSHVDKLSSFIFSPSDVRFDIEFENDEDGSWGDRGKAASQYLNRQFSRRKCDTAFSEANVWSLVKGCCLIKLVWGYSGFEPWIVQPEFFGVLREDIQSLDRQDAFVHTFYLTPTQFRRLLGNHPDKEEIVRKASSGFMHSMEDVTGDDVGRGMVTGGGPGVPAILLPGQTGSQQQGNVDWVTAPVGPMLGEEVSATLIRVDDLWVMNDEREDWTTIRFVEPDIIVEGQYRHRNLSDIPKEHPFIKVCSNEEPNYFWGRSELANVWQNQKLLTARVNNFDTIFNQIAKPARAFKGFPGITDEKARMLLTPGGVFTDANPTGEIKDLSPTMPQGFFEYLQMLDSWFDEAAGFTPILQGQGEPGVRAGVHADTLLRTSSPRLRTRALVVEKQVADFGDLCLKMLQNKDAKTLMAGTPEAFILDQLPDPIVSVDSHSSSPAFSTDNANMAVGLRKMGVIDDESTLEMLHPPRMDILIARSKKHAKAQQEQLEELKKSDPDAWAKAISGHRRR